MYEWFTSSAQHTIIDAQEQARTLGHGYIGTEHLLLALLPPRPCAATNVLEVLKIPPEELRERLLAMIEPSQHAPSGHMPFTQAAKKALEFSLRGAVALLLDYVGTEHLLLGIACEGSGAAGQALADAGATTAAIEREVAALSETRYRVASPGPLRGFLTDPDPA